MAGLSPSQEVQSSAQYTALTNYLSGQTQVLEDAQDQFAEPIEGKYQQTGQASDVESLLWTAWQSVVAIAAGTPYTSSDSLQKLADFVLNLEYRPDLVKNGQTCQIDGQTVWSDLPIFGSEMREAWNFAATDSSNLTQREQWVNLNAWTSTLVSAAHTETSDKPDFSLYCIWTVRAALEQPASTSVPDVAVEAAALWFINAAAAIGDFSSQNKSFQGKVAAPGPLFKDKNWTGFSEDRWNVWTARFNELQPSLASDQAKQLVAQALDVMGNTVDQ